MYTLGDIPRKSALFYPDRTAVVFEGTSYTHQEFNQRVNRLANSLANRGMQKGDRVAVLAENTHKYLETYFAAAKLGMSVTPLNFRLSDEEIIHVANDSEAVCLFAGDGYEERAQKIGKSLKNIYAWIAYDMKNSGYISYETMLAEASDAEPNIDVDENDMAVLMYTGGTTGLPKGVMMSHRNLMTAVLSATIAMEFTKEDATCFVLPLFHVSFWPALCALMVGGKVVINRRPELSGILDLIAEERCTHINAVPTLYSWIMQLENLDDYDLSSLRSVSYAGSPMPIELLKQCIGKFGNIMNQAYGMTEALGVSMLPAKDHFVDGDRSRLLASAGKAILCADVGIVDENDKLLGPNEIGEIVLKGKHVMMGYWKNPEQTSQTIRNGWYHSGDMGYIDEEGYLFLVDRKADMIVTGGENVYPKEVEDVLYQHPAVSMAAVVSAPDEKWGERVQAAVVLKPDQNAAADELVGFCKERLAGYKCPKVVEIWDALPTTPVGKILRKDVKKKFWEGHARTIG